MTADIYGREYAAVREISVGAIVEVDGGFTCIKQGSLREVEVAEDGLYIKCCCGEHYLDGQLDFDSEAFYVGLYPARISVKSEPADVYS